MPYNTLSDLVIDIADIIREKEGTTALVPVQSFGDRLRAIHSGGNSGGSSTISTPDNWKRPADRPEKPEMEDNTIRFLFGVGENSPNDFAFMCNTSSPTAGYDVDWGDGTVSHYNGGVKAECLYGFESLDLPVDSNGYKMVWITVRPTSGNITGLDIATYRHSTRPTSGTICSQLFELYIQCPSLTSLVTYSTSGRVRHRLLEIFSLDINNITGTLNYLLAECTKLRSIEKLYIEKAAAVTYFMQDCYSFNGTFPEGVSFKNVTVSFMPNCYSYNQPFPESVVFTNITSYFMNNCYSYNQPFHKGITFESPTVGFMQNCYSYNQRFSDNVVFTNITTYFMYCCYSYNQPFHKGITFPKAAGGFMQNCSSFNFGVIVDLAGRTSAIGTSFIGDANNALKWLRFLNMGTVHNAITISYSSLDVPALVDLFGDLCDRTGTTTGTITITGCYGAASLTTEQLAIATLMNWTVVK